MSASDPKRTLGFSLVLSAINLLLGMEVGYTLEMNFRPNKTLLLFLVTAFLTVQWTATHIHLAEHHNHNDNHHQHDLEAHAHFLTDHQIDSIDSEVKTDDSNVIELDHKSSLPIAKKITPTITVIASVILQLPSLQSASFKIPIFVDDKPGHFDRSTVNPRAPPQTS